MESESGFCLERANQPFHNVIVNSKANEKLSNLESDLLRFQRGHFHHSLECKRSPTPLGLSS